MDAIPASDNGFDAALKALEDLDTGRAETDDAGPARKPAPDALPVAVVGLADDEGPAAMIAAFQQILNGGIYAPTLLLTEPSAVAEPAAAALDPQILETLTPRQCEVLRLLGKGQANKEIARALDISEGTVKIHLAAIFRLLDVRNRTEAVLKASALDL